MSAMRRSTDEPDRFEECAVCGEDRPRRELWRWSDYDGRPGFYQCLGFAECDARYGHFVADCEADQAVAEQERTL